MTLLLSMPGGSEWTIVLLAFGIILIPKLFYLKTLQSTLNAISVENRKIPSSNVWLLLIPIFSIFWHFIVVKKLADSISAEAGVKNINIEDQKIAYKIGIAMCLLNCFFFIPVLNIITGIASLICLLLFWIQINTYKTKFINS